MRDPQYRFGLRVRRLRGAVSNLRGHRRQPVHEHFHRGGETWARCPSQTRAELDSTVIKGIRLESQKYKKMEGREPQKEVAGDCPKEDPADPVRVLVITVRLFR